VQTCSRSNQLLRSSPPSPAPTPPIYIAIVKMDFRKAEIPLGAGRLGEATLPSDPIFIRTPLPPHRDGLFMMKWRRCFRKLRAGQIGPREKSHGVNPGSGPGHSPTCCERAIKPGSRKRDDLACKDRNNEMVTPDSRMVTNDCNRGGG
jgi:hypothetical protein